MTIKDMKRVVDLLVAEWDLGRTVTHTKGRLCGWISLMGYLQNGRVFVHREWSQIVGISIHTTKEKHRVYMVIHKILTHLPKIANNKDYKIRYQNVPEFVPIMQNYDCELELLIVDKKCRGNGIGKEVLNKALQSAKECGNKNICLYTDAKCNYKFYDTQGFNRVGETILKIADNDPDNNIKCFIYGKEL